MYRELQWISRFITFFCFVNVKLPMFLNIIITKNERGGFLFLRNNNTLGVRVLGIFTTLFRRIIQKYIYVINITPGPYRFPASFYCFQVFSNMLQPPW